MNALVSCLCTDRDVDAGSCDGCTEAELLARAYCEERGLDPDDDAADGVLVWQVVAKERMGK